jgi:flagellar biosynthesis GTPase FlhF
LGVALGTGLFAQTPSSRPIIYPSKGQSAEQQAKDESACYSWASKYTGFDPAKALADLHAQQAQAQQQSQQVQQAAQQHANASANAPARGAVGGAAVGAVGGAIGGNAGKGAAIGAAVGLLSGAAARRQRTVDAAHFQEQQQAQINAQQAQLQAASQQKLGEYNRAFQTCMQGRGYAMSY